MVSTRSLVSLENRDTEQQSQLLVVSAIVALVVKLAKASLKSPLERVAKERRWVREAVRRYWANPADTLCDYAGDAESRWVARRIRVAELGNVLRNHHWRQQQ
nr:hypothetical protein CFP56_64238 [Quercus suber]